MAQKKEEASKEEAPVASNRNAQPNQPPQEGKKKKKKNWRKPYSLSFRIPTIQKNDLDNVFSMARNFMEFKDKEEKIMRQPSLPKIITFSPDVLITSLIIKSSILSLKDIKEIIFSLKEIKSSILSSTQTFV
ncbi:hypothetical protein O181_125253 [Austropuccinia psidii MF-1]|uniref:Uncharacterized protein n=1 Tax=Austropuccinia psidii MF-1 TaxID=1389203 RepID=A0A9Q3KPC7_9BASI|nr:hypothetical protein [Austropuccinia psidii MF-1]